MKDQFYLHKLKILTSITLVKSNFIGSLLCSTVTLDNRGTQFKSWWHSRNEISEKCTYLHGMTIQSKDLFTGRITTPV